MQQGCEAGRGQQLAQVRGLLHASTAATSHPRLFTPALLLSPPAAAASLPCFVAAIAALVFIPQDNALESVLA